MSDEYTMAQPEKHGEGRLVCVERNVVERVCEHFAIRFTPEYHDMGEGMMIESWTLDHIPTGLKVWNGPFSSGATESQCRAAAEMLSTAPVDWGSVTDLTGTPFGKFAAAALHAAGEDRRVTWDEWEKLGQNEAGESDGT